MQSLGVDLADEAAELGASWGRRLARLTRMLQRRSRLEGNGSFARADVLALLAEHGRLRVTELAALRRCSQPATTQLVDRLVGEGLVSRGGEDGDRRVTRLVLTADGERVLADNRERAAVVLAERIRELVPADRSALAAALPVLDRLLAEPTAEDQA